MQEAILYEKLARQNVRCQVCQRRCQIAPGQKGYCQTRLNQAGKLYTLIFGLASSVCVDPIEKKPVYHYKPGTQALSLGTWGCNFRCIFCQNYDISFVDGKKLEEIARQVNTATEKEEIDDVRHQIPTAGILPPEAVPRLAHKEGCRGIAWTYNEPIIWLEYTLKASKLAKQAGLYTVYVTNGYATTSALDTIGPYLDVWRVDIKSMDDRFYQEVARIPKVSPILEATLRAQRKWKMHVEVVTNIIPTLNDAAGNLEKTARWIHDNLGPQTPWHVTRFFPYLELKHLPPTPLETLEKAQGIGKKVGLKFVYIGNVAGFEDQTACPQCGAIVMAREEYQTRLLGVDSSGRCQQCGAALPIIF